MNEIRIAFPSRLHLGLIDLNGEIGRIDGGTGIISTVAGNGSYGFGGDGGPATAASLAAPSKVLALADGSLLIADSSNNRIREVDPNGTITTSTVSGAP